MRQPALSVPSSSACPYFGMVHIRADTTRFQGWNCRNTGVSLRFCLAIRGEGRAGEAHLPRPGARRRPGRSDRLARLAVHGPQHRVHALGHGRCCTVGIPRRYLRAELPGRLPSVATRAVNGRRSSRTDCRSRNRMAALLGHAWRACASASRSRPCLAAGRGPVFGWMPSIAAYLSVNTICTALSDQYV